MFVSHDRAKLIQTVVYFATNTRFCGKIKLIKLLYLLDFSHFRETGKSVTGLEYYAWKLGPVPLDVYQEWDALEQDFAEAIAIEPERVIDYTRDKVVPRVPFDPEFFTKRELRLLEQLSARFRDELTKPLINFTHAELGPWHKIWDGGAGKNARIPYALSVPDDDPNFEAILASAAEYQGAKAAAALN